MTEDESRTDDRPWVARPNTALILLCAIVALLVLAGIAPMLAGIFIPVVAIILVVLIGVIVTIIQSDRRGALQDGIAHMESEESSSALDGETSVAERIAAEPSCAGPPSISARADVAANPLEDQAIVIARFASTNEAAVRRNALEAAGV